MQDLIPGPEPFEKCDDQNNMKIHLKSTMRILLLIIFAGLIGCAQKNNTTSSTCSKIFNL